MFKRRLEILKPQAFFLFGARGTGKTTPVKTTFSEEEALIVDLLDPDTFGTLEADPSHLKSIAEPALRAGKWIVLDEIQKVPALLDLVHYLIENRNARFGLTGSSARKFRRGAYNLLAGRAFMHRLFPLLPCELGRSFSLETYLTWGGLPKIYALNDVERYRYLQSYVETYLQEQIVAEQVIRKLPPFRRFLQVAAQVNGDIINYSNIAADINSDPVSVKSYFQILEDTLLGFMLEPFHTSIRKRQRKSPKFYLVDPGILRAQAKVLDVPVKKQTYYYGRLFETFIINLIRAKLEYQFRQYQLSYLRTKDNAEVDLIIERGGEKTFFVEIKSAKTVRDRDLERLNAFVKDLPNSRAVCLYQGTLERIVGNVSLLPWEKGVREMGI